MCMTCIVDYLAGFKNQSVHTAHMSLPIFKILHLLIQHSLSHVNSISNQKMPHDQIFLQFNAADNVHSIYIYIHRLGNSKKSAGIGNCT